ncbi:RRP7A protein, partial [Podargus strigoides]|nr:RRP7A protein [Podargus strigoides]
AASRRAKMAAAEQRVAGAAPAGYAGEERARGGSGSVAGAAAGTLTGASPAALAVKFGERQRSAHCLLVKEHQVREGAGTAHPPHRTLFVLNVPPYCSPDALSRLFARCGRVQSVEVCEKPEPGEKKEKFTSKFFNRKTVTGFQVAYVVFRKPSGVQVAKALSREGPLLISTESHPVKTGISSKGTVGVLCIMWAWQLSCLTLLSLQEEAKAAKEEGIPDEEGWVKVTRKGRKPGLPQTEAANLWVLEREKQKRACKELPNFYAWQHHETKREHEYIAQLRKKFEEDKQRIALMEFQPY